MKMKEMKNKLSALGLFAAAIVMAPEVVSAVTTVESLIKKVSGWISLILPLLIMVAVLFFFWGLIDYLKGDGAEKTSEGLKRMGMGLIVLFVMVSLWGLIAVVQGIFNIDSNSGGNVHAPRVICSGGTCDGSGTRLGAPGRP